MENREAGNLMGMGDSREVMEYSKTWISLGAGVQSSVMALMASRGEITPMVDFAVFADTQDEPTAVYEWLDYLEKQLSFPVHRVTKGKLSEESLIIVKSKKTGKLYSKNKLPLYCKEGALLNRSCTMDFKITPIQRFIRSQLKKGEVGLQMMGISTDEAHRMKPSRVPYVENSYPLIDLGMSRAACLKWAEKNNLPKPPRSACVFCPYHSSTEWINLRDNDPEGWNRAIQFEKDFREAFKGQNALNTSDVFLHKQRVPLDQVQFQEDTQRDLWGNECEGMCGV